jgi:hypothetical protein
VHPQNDKISKDNIGAGPRTSLKINSRGANVLWPVGPNDKRDDFPNRHAWHWKFKWREVHTTFLFDAKRLRTCELKWPYWWCQISTEVGKLADRKVWGINTVEDFERT